MKQESIPVGCVPPAFLIVGGVPIETPPGQRPPPLGQRPPDRDSLGSHLLDRDAPG